MRTIFADTFYWTASINPRDNWQGQVIAITRRLEQFCLVTTEEGFLSIIFDLERTNQLSLLPDKDLVDLCPPIEPY